MPTKMTALAIKLILKMIVSYIIKLLFDINNNLEITYNIS